MRFKTITLKQLALATEKTVDEARKHPIVVRAPGKQPMIIRPLIDDDAADELLVQSPSFRASIRSARRRAAGKGIPLAQARAMTK